MEKKDCICGCQWQKVEGRVIGWEPSLKKKKTQQKQTLDYLRPCVSGPFLTPPFQFAFWIVQALYILGFPIKIHPTKNALRREANMSGVKLWWFV